MELATRHLLTMDPVLAQIIGRVGPCTFLKRDPNFETLARSITFQQLSGKAAGTIFERLRKAVGRRFTAAAFLKLSEADLRVCGLSRQKIASLTDLAGRVVSREINFRKFPSMPDEEIIEQLCRVRGIGVWTVQMFLMFALERPNILPLSDLGIRSAVRKPTVWPAFPHRLNSRPSRPAGIHTALWPVGTCGAV